MLKCTLRKHFYRDVQLHGSGILLPDKLILHRVWRNVSMSARWSLSASGVSGLWQGLHPKSVHGWILRQEPQVPTWWS